MNKEDLFETIKGNIKSANLSSIIEDRKQKFINWIEPYYLDEDLDRLNARKVMYSNFDFLGIYSEPNWPKGKVRVLSKQFQKWQSEISKLQSTQTKIIKLVFPEYDDDDYDCEYAVDVITVRKIT